MEHSHGKEVELGATSYCGPGSLLTLCNSGSGGSGISLKADSISHQLVQTQESVQVSKSLWDWMFVL